MKSLREQLTERAVDAFKTCGFDPKYGEVVVSNRPDLGQFQCNGALSAAKQYKTNPRQIAQQVLDRLSHQKEIFKEISLEGPGFINLTLTDTYILEHTHHVESDPRLGCDPSAESQKMIIDYGGPNIAKSLHVGHLRSAIIGESLKHLARFLGHEVIGDAHLGDWGTQMGMVISELKRRQPDLPYFNPNYRGPYPAEPPVTISELEEIYPTVSARSKTDPEVLEAARLATYELQQGRQGFRALWQHIYDISVIDLKENYDKLGIHFDLWMGESDTKDRIAALIERVQQEGWAYTSEGAIVIDVSDPEDKKEIPPLMLVKSDGSVLYATTDLATIDQRMNDFAPDGILYVVDGRQSDHFCQVFRGAYKTGIALSTVKLEHIGFGTMNGKDGKPFKTRSGDTLKLKEFIQMITDKALVLMEEADIAKNYDADERMRIAHRVGIATLKFADLMNHRTKNYIFDLDRFASFEGRTGPYLLYTAVRIKSILRNATERGLKPGIIGLPASDIERNILLKISELPDVLHYAFENRAPNFICDYAYTMASLFNNFYHEHHILNEKDKKRQGSWLGLSVLSLKVLELALELLGIEVPERM